MNAGINDAVVVNIINKSDCRVRITGAGLLPDESPSLTNAYSKLFVDHSAEYLTAHNGVGASALAYMHQMMDDYRIFSCLNCLSLLLYRCNSVSSAVISFREVGLQVPFVRYHSSKYPPVELSHSIVPSSYI